MSLHLFSIINSVTVNYKKFFGFYSREVFATILTLSKYRLGYQWISAAICRGTYYFAWLISEGANIVIGLGYSGKKEVNGKTVYSWYVFTKYSNRFAIYGSEYPRQFM
jgi:hypothetical protein